MVGFDIQVVDLAFKVVEFQVVDFTIQFRQFWFLAFNFKY